MKTPAPERLFAIQILFRTSVWASTCGSIGRKSRSGSKGIREGKPMPKYQNGYIWRKGKNWYGRWWEDVIENGQVVRKQRARKLAEYSDRYRSESDVRPLLDDILRPLNEGKTTPEGTLSVSQFVEDHYLPFGEDNFKPSTIAGYKKM